MHRNCWLLAQRTPKARRRTVMSTMHLIILLLFSFVLQAWSHPLEEGKPWVVDTYVVLDSNAPAFHYKKSLQVAQELIHNKLGVDLLFKIAQVVELEQFLAQGKATALEAPEGELNVESITSADLDLPAPFLGRHEYIESAAYARCVFRNGHEKRCLRTKEEDLERAREYLIALREQMQRKRDLPLTSDFLKGMKKGDAYLFVTNASLLADVPLLWRYDTSDTGTQSAGGLESLFVSTAQASRGSDIQTDLAGWLIAKEVGHARFYLGRHPYWEEQAKGCLTVEGPTEESFAISMEKEYCDQDRKQVAKRKLELTAQAYLANGDWKSALNEYEKLKVLDPHDGVIGIADLYAYHLGEYDKALDVLETYLKKLKREKDAMPKKEYSFQLASIETEIYHIRRAAEKRKGKR